MLRWLPGCLLYAGALALAADLPPEVILLQRARVRMARNLANLPNYTCMQTIERSVRTSAKRKERVSDVLRIEVALVHGKELFAWPGSGRFVDTEIGEMVPGGAIGTGTFGLHAKAIFQTTVPQFTYGGEETEGGRRMLRWNFTVAQLSSGYVLRVGPREAMVGYHGSFWADAESLDLIRFNVEADMIPPELQLESAGDSVEYQRVDIAGESFLLPAKAEMHLVGFGGGASINRTTFDSCRHYSGESVLFFEDPGPDRKATAPVRVLEAPKDVTLDLSLETPIRADKMAVGDPVQAVLARPAKIGTGIVAPKGAAVRGRLTYLKERYDRFPGYQVGLLFSELEWDNTRVQFRAILEQVSTISAQVYSQGPGRDRISMLGNETIVGSVFFVRGNTLRLGRGLRMTWRTLPAEAEDKR